jgi:hypothetical protein
MPTHSPVGLHLTSLPVWKAGCHYCIAPTSTRDTASTHTCSLCRTMPHPKKHKHLGCLKKAPSTACSLTHQRVHPHPNQKQAHVQTHSTSTSGHHHPHQYLYRTPPHLSSPVLNASLDHPQVFPSNMLTYIIPYAQSRLPPLVWLPHANMMLPHPHRTPEHPQVHLHSILPHPLLP